MNTHIQKLLTAISKWSNEKLKNYYTKIESDEKYLTEHQDISGKQDIIIISNETETTKTILPNKYYKWGVVNSLNLTLENQSNTNILNKYIFEFTTSDGFDINITPEVSWFTEKPLDNGMTYQVSISNNIAVCYGGFKV